MSVTENEVLDARGMNCPLPVLKTKKTIDGMTKGQILKVIATDPGSVNDMDSWARRTGNEIVDREENDGEFVYFIKKK
ncbi:MAG: sulfurtransferase TusA family protein [Leptospirales bacterium]